MNKWEKTGLLEGLDDQSKDGMARLLEQAKNSPISARNSGDVEGFAAAFPIVRRVFGS